MRHNEPELAGLLLLGDLIDSHPPIHRSLDGPTLGWGIER